MAEVTVRITPAQLNAITGRCRHHDRELQLVPYADEGLETLTEAWLCPGLDYKHDAELAANQALISAITAKPSWPTERRDPEDYREFERLSGIAREIVAKCTGSWMFAVPLTPVAISLEQVTGHG